MSCFVLCQEEERSETELLQVQADENVLYRFGEEEAACITGLWLVELPEELVLVQEIEEQESGEGKTVDDW